MILVDTYGQEDKALQNSVNDLTKAINSMITLLKNAEKELSKDGSEDHNISAKLEKLVEQNKDMARAIVLLMELSREHLPKISAHTGESTRLMKRPAAIQRFQPRPREAAPMPLPPEPNLPSQGRFPSIPQAPSQEPKKKRGLFGFRK